MGAIYYATPLRAGAMLAGKALANTILALAIVAACFVGCVIVLAVQDQVSLNPAPVRDRVGAAARAHVPRVDGVRVRRVRRDQQPLRDVCDRPRHDGAVRLVPDARQR